MMYELLQTNHRRLHVLPRLPRFMRKPRIVFADEESFGGAMGCEEDDPLQ